MRDKQIDMFEDPNIEDQIKLATLTVYNWGSFNGLHSININPDGTLITGENGAGKSTSIDGLMVLLCSAGRVSFNMAAAQGDKSDRSLVSYMRGSYGRFEDESGSSAKNLRNGTVATVLKATYKHTASDRIVVLYQRKQQSAFRCKENICYFGIGYFREGGFESFLQQ